MTVGPAEGLTGMSDRAGSQYIKDVELDEERNEPYIQIRPDVRLTPPRESDIDDVLRLYSLPEVYVTSPDWTVPIERSRAEGIVKGCLDRSRNALRALMEGKKVTDADPFKILRKHPEGDFMGTFGSHPTPFATPYPQVGPFDASLPWTNSCMDIGYSLLPEYRGAGLAFEVTKTHLDSYVWPYMRMRAVGMTIMKGNTASLALARRLGAKEVYDHDERIRAERGGGLQPSIKLMILRDSP